MTIKRKRPMTLEEHNTQMKAEGTWDDFVERQERRRKEHEEFYAGLPAEEEPILKDLAAVGTKVKSVWDLIGGSACREALPVLLRHLLLPYSDRTREGIARSLAVPGARKFWATLVEEYRKAPMGIGPIVPGQTKEFRLGAKDGLACAVAAAATEDVMDDLVALARDATLGSSRILLLSALKKSKSSVAKTAIEELASDADLKIEIASWRRRKSN